MKKIKSVHLIGLGSIGSMYASLLQAVEPGLLTVIADAERRARYRKEGITVNGKPLAPPYRAPDDGGGPADLVLVCVKQHHLAQAIEDIRGSVGAETIIISLLNGITSEEIIGEALGADHLLYAHCVETDATRSDGGVVFSTSGTIVFGERTNETHSSRVEAVKGLLARAGIGTRVPRDMLKELWWKFMLNVGINPLSAILRAPYGVFQQVAEARELFAASAREAIELSHAAGVDLDDGEIDRCLEIFERLSPEGKTSMLQDVEAARKTEIELFAGTVVSLGKRYGVATPVNDLILKLVRAIEKGYGAS